MDSKTKEDVLKKRGKPSPSHPSIYQRVVIVTGVITLFLAVGTSPTMVPLISAGVIGITLLILFLLNAHKSKKEEEGKLDSTETLPLPEESAAGKEQIFPQVDGEAAADLKEIFPEGKNADDLREELYESQEKAAEPQVNLRMENLNRVDLPGFPGEKELASIQQMVLKLEEKLADMQEMILKLEEKAALIQENLLKSAEKVDLQMILSDPEEKPEKAVH